MKQIKIFITVLIVLLITTSIASATYSSCNSGKYQESQYYRFHHSDNHRPWTNSGSCSGNDCGTCSNGGCGCSGGNCNTCQENDCNTCQGGDCPCNGGSCNTGSGDTNTPPNTCPGGNCDNGPGDTNTPPNNCPGGNCDSGSGDTTTPPVNPPTDTTGTTTYKLCSNNVCNVGGNGQVLTLTNYNNAKDPTHDQLLTFLKADNTDAQPYTSQFVCSDFAQTLHNNAEAAGIRSAWVGCSFTKGVGHAFNEFQTTDKGIVYIDCTGVPGGKTYQDKILTCVVGEPLTAEYLFRSGNIENMGVIKDMKAFW